MTTVVTISTTEGASKNVSSITVNDEALARVLRDFNPAANADVDDVKVLFAAVIQKMLDLQRRPDATQGNKRGAAIAITELELTQMPAVKAYYAKF